MGDGTPLYSVVIPSYDRCNLLVEAVDSVLSQGYPNLEIIVIDDGSRDATALAMRRYGDAVRYAYQPTRGQSAARNRGIRMARGQFVALLDSDDIWLPGKIAHDLDMFAANPETDAIVGDVDYFTRDIPVHTSLHEACGITFTANARHFGDDLLRLHRGPLCATCAMVFRKATLDRLGDPVFDETLRYDEDWDLEFRLFAAFRVLFSRRPVATCRQFDDHTRPFGLTVDPRPAADQRRLDRNTLAILDRYRDQDVWSPELRAAIRHHARELQDRLSGAGATA